MNVGKSWFATDLPAAKDERWAKSDYPIYRVDIIGRNDHSDKDGVFDDSELVIPVIYESPSYKEISDKTRELHRAGFITTDMMVFDGA